VTYRVQSKRPVHYGLQRALGEFAKYAALSIISVFFLIPWAWMLSTSLKNPQELSVYPPVWIPHPIRWDNFATALSRSGFAKYVGNTLRIAALTVLGAVLSNSTVAYSISVLRWKGQNVLFALILATMMLPGAVTFIPLYVIFRHLGWLNTFRPLIVPAFFGNAYFIFLLRQFFLTLPPELADAARIDGCSDFGILWRIILPLSRPALAVIALFQFIGSWNDYFGPLIYLSDENKYTVALGIANMRTAYGLINFAWVMAATTMSVAPIVILFFFAQRTFIQGISLTGLKQ
jgi:multiple sugar transport system permease protein